MLEADDGRTRVRSEKGLAAAGWLSTAGVQLTLLCFLLLIVGGTALAGAEDSASLSDASWARVGNVDIEAGVHLLVRLAGDRQNTPLPITRTCSFTRRRDTS